MLLLLLLLFFDRLTAGTIEAGPPGQK
eukprot:SAG22_NODE_13098_length_419_cov_0.806250_1_plen_26_part_01